jgi:NAD(P)-dependent dehydrogenase (short-subunit alcohol dehydrogenase family)
MNTVPPQRVVITAGAAGIGRAFAKRFAQSGARIALCDIDPETVAATKRALPDALCQVADVTSEPQMQAFFDAAQAHLGGVDVMCANAGTGGPAGPIETLDLAGWRACLSANLDGAFLACCWAAPLMKAQGSGTILLTSSTAGLFGYPNRSPYATAKWGIIGLMKTLAMELGPDGVRVNALCPGSVTGPRMDRVITAEATARGVDEATQRDMYVQGVSMKTWVTAEDIAETAHWLASSAAARISGQAMAIDGHTETLSL